MCIRDSPGLALFYGGLVRVRSVVNMMLFSVSAMGVVGVLWILFGYSMNYFAPGESGFAGSPFKDFGLIQTAPEDYIGCLLYTSRGCPNDPRTPS